MVKGWKHSMAETGKWRKAGISGWRNAKSRRICGVMKTCLLLSSINNWTSDWFTITELQFIHSFIAIVITTPFKLPVIYCRESMRYSGSQWMRFVTASKFESIMFRGSGVGGVCSWNGSRMDIGTSPRSILVLRAPNSHRLSSPLVSKIKLPFEGPFKICAIFYMNAYEYTFESIKIKM